jgi:CheB methylesterase
MPKSDVNLGEDYSGAHEEGLPAAAPDLVEERERELIDNIVPTLGYSLIPMVGLGGSAGSAAIILSGADGDGAIGIKRIKERGGVTIAQDPEEAEHHGMPQSEIATGMVDCVLRVAEMPQRLLEYHAREQDLRVPPEEGPPGRTSKEPSTVAGANPFHRKERHRFLGIL